MVGVGPASKGGGQGRQTDPSSAGRGMKIDEDEVKGRVLAVGIG